MRVTRNFTNQFPHFHSLGVLHGRGAHDLRAKPAMALDQPQQEQRRRCTEQEVGCSSQDRAIIELEFVQCLANPHYLNWLAQNRYFDDPSFISYIKYLEYWRQPQYAKYLRYPHCLFFLDMVLSADFRKAITSNKVAEFIHVQQFYFWQNYALNRAKEAAATA